MEQKAQQQAPPVFTIKEEIADTNCTTKETASQRVAKTSLKNSESSDVVNKMEGSSSPTAANNLRIETSPKANIVTVHSPLNSSTTSSNVSKSAPTHLSSSNSHSTTPSPPLAIPLTQANNSNGNSNVSASETEQTSPTSKSLLKVKRLLSTLVQFGNSLNADVGESVKNLIFNLACNAISIQEFHSNLQEVTNFPLRPFVLPFLNNFIPLLQREISVQAKSTKQNVQHYIRQNENCVLDPLCSSAELNEVFNQMDAVSSSNQSEVFSNTVLPSKRRYECHESTVACHKADSPTDSHIHAAPSPIKKQALNMCLSHNHSHAVNNHQTSSFYSADYFQIPPPPCLSTSSNWTLPASAAPISKECNSQTDERKSTGTSEWNNIYVMLNCILSMVEKTKRALAILQERNVNENSSGEIGEGIQTEHPLIAKRNSAEEVKRTASELMAHTIRLTEEKVASVRKKAEDTVNEVKRQALLELQRVIISVDCKSMEFNPNGICTKIPSESKKSFLLNNEFDFSTHNGCATNEKLDPFNLQTNNCWNCGRKAQETCSGCNLAKYCGSFCQHKDWESHHQICSGYPNSNLINLDKPAAVSRNPLADPFITRANMFSDLSLINKSNSADISNLTKLPNNTSEVCRLLPFPVNMTPMPGEKPAATRNASIGRPATPIASTNTSLNSITSTKLKK